jgi:tRNA pseudouridine38-40 synthase
VRSIVGTLERVGAGAWPPGRVAAALAARDRAECGPVAPPEGLYLTAVRYPEDPFGEGAELIRADSKRKF